MNGHLSSLVIGIAIAAANVNSCGQSITLHCIDPTYTIVAGTTIPFENPCATTPGETAQIDHQWVSGDWLRIFERPGESKFPEGFDTPENISVSPPLRYLHVDATAR